MGVLEIIIIIIGIGVIIGSFFLPEGNKGVEISIPDEVIREIIDKETKKAIFQIEEHTEETVSAINAKTERSMERLSNEKIMAIDEFSNTILEKIYKNHEEAVFLYDMLCNKHVQLKNTLSDVEKGIKLSQQENGRKAEDGFAENGNYKEDIKKKNIAQESDIKNTLQEDNTVEFTVNGKEEDSLKEGTEEIHKENIDEIKSEKEKEGTEDKEMILRYHKEGKNDVEIAKILGMGVGEVKLIIGLFEAN